MKVSLNWLQDYVTIDPDVDALARLLTFAGIEVEGVTHTGTTVGNVVVARIASSEKHPDADRLSVCQVEDGSGTLRQIVCGARNYRVGDKVPLALPGAVLPGDFKIKKGKLRGMASDGMLCSARELELAEDAEGLMILDPEAPVGTPLSEWIPRDTILDIEVTPNRPDLLGYLGLAREIAALTGVPVVRPDAAPLARDTESPAAALDATDACPFYTATRIENVSVGPSPAWLANRLLAVGLRPINNIVDITNFVLLETGQPLHAFDADRLDGGLRVRFARDAESLATLDGVSHPLDGRHLLIADASGPVAIAGVMGGEATGVTTRTTSILLESAWFQPSVIRRSAHSLGLSTDSSQRFERRVDPLGVETAAARAASLIAEVAGGSSRHGVATAGSPPPSSINVALRPEKLNQVMGYPIDEQKYMAILTEFGLKLSDRSGTATTWSVPSFRPDLEREIDLIEEVARVLGLDDVPERRVAWMSGITEADRAYDQRLALSRYLAGAGYFEARTLSLISEDMGRDDVFGMGEPARVRNPLGADSAMLRPSLLPGLMRCAAMNIRQGAGRVALFEIGRIFSAESAREERMALGLVLTGLAEDDAAWHGTTTREYDFFDIKGAFESLPQVDPDVVPCGRGTAALAAEIRLDGELLGWLGQVSPARARALGIESPLLVAEIEVDRLGGHLRRPRRYRDIPRFPAVTRDIALVVPAGVSHARVLATIVAADEPLLESARLFDVFEDPTGVKLPVGSKSMAYSLTFRSRERTLEGDEVSEAHSRIRQRIEEELEARTRT